MIQKLKIFIKKIIKRITIFIKTINDNNIIIINFFKKEISII